MSTEAAVGSYLCYGLGRTDPELTAMRFLWAMRLRALTYFLCRRRGGDSDHPEPVDPTIRVRFPDAAQAGSSWLNCSELAFLRKLIDAKSSSIC
jgi:hypothetical protein